MIKFSSSNQSEKLDTVFFLGQIDETLLDETDCSGKFLRYFSRLYILLCLCFIEHSFVFRKPKQTRYVYIICINTPNN